MVGFDTSGADGGVSKGTILGVNITFEVITLISVFLRLYVRLRIMKAPGWDDVMVVLSSLTATLGTVFVSLATNYRLGQRMSLLSSEEFETYISYFYVSNAAYNMSTALIKLSLLFQYLRVFESGMIRKTCIGLIVIISIWGFIYSFMAWFPCFPVRAYWDWSLTDAKCYAYGTKVRAPFVATYESHSALNLIFDLIVFLTPISIFWTRQRTGREYAALLGLFLLGAMVVVVSTWRLAAIVQHQAGWKPELDFTYYAATPILLACLELDIAVLAASMPIFWPVLLRFLPGIVVTKEVRVSRHRRWGASEVELDDASLNSQVELRRKERKGSSSKKEAFVVERVVPAPVVVVDKPLPRPRREQVEERGVGEGEREEPLDDRLVESGLERAGVEGLAADGRSSVPVSHNLAGRWEQLPV